MHGPPLSLSNQSGFRVLDPCSPAGVLWTTSSALLARGLERVGQLRRGTGYCGVGVDDVGQVVARAGLVEPLHCGVEARPEFGWAAAAGPRSQLVGRTCALGVSDEERRDER